MSPPEGGNPGKSEYVWTIDTITSPGSMQTTMRDVWGSSPNDVYVVGHNELGTYKMFHCDGHSWQRVMLAASEGGQISHPFALSAVSGFSSNDINAVGQRLDLNPTPPSEYSGFESHHPL